MCTTNSILFQVRTFLHSKQESELSRTFVRFSKKLEKFQQKCRSQAKEYTFSVHLEFFEHSVILSVIDDTTLIYSFYSLNCISNVFVLSHKFFLIYIFFDRKRKFFTSFSIFNQSETFWFQRRSWALEEKFTMNTVTDDHVHCRCLRAIEV
jgi:hypothetical protein